MTIAITNKSRLTTLSLLALLAACGAADDARDVPRAQPAETTNVDIGSHIVHFNALPTDELPPEIARAYSIVRSKNRAMLTVSVLTETGGESVPAAVEVKTVNLTGQLKNVTMRRVDEGDAIYYIGETPVANQETLVFDINVTPEGVSQAADLRFKRQFFSD